MPFNKILGQEKATAYLSKIVLSQKLPNALLFHGEEGIGKALAAVDFAKALNCQDAQARASGDSCGVCASCLAIAKGTHPDVVFADFEYQARLEVKKDFTSKGYAEELEKEIAKQQHISVDTIREVTAKSQQKPVGGGWKVFIIDSAQSMQGAAANALLKYIEEPPYRTVWVLITDKKAVMLKTILSRCQSLAFAPLADETVTQILNTNGFVSDHLALSARYSAGSVKNAMRVSEALALLQSAGEGPAWPGAVAASLSRTLVASRQEAQTVLDVLCMAMHGAWRNEMNTGKKKKLQENLKKFENYKRCITRNVSPALVLETALMSMDGLNIKIFD